jgi:hypothetical protein
MATGTRSLETVGGSQHRPRWSVRPDQTATATRPWPSSCARCARSKRSGQGGGSRAGRGRAGPPCARSRPDPRRAPICAPNEPERRPLHAYVIPGRPGPGRTLHEAAVPWTPNEPERRPEAAPERRLEYVLPATTLAPGQTLHEPAACWTPNEPKLIARPPAPAPERHGRHGFPGSHGPDEQMPNQWLRWP